MLMFHSVRNAIAKADNDTSEEDFLSLRVKTKEEKVCTWLLIYNYMQWVLMYVYTHTSWVLIYTHKRSAIHSWTLIIDNDLGERRSWLCVMD